MKRQRIRLKPNVHHPGLQTDPMWTLSTCCVLCSGSSRHVTGDTTTWDGLDSLPRTSLYSLQVCDLREVWTFEFSHRPTESSKRRHVLPKDRVQCAGDVVFMVVNGLFPQSDLHVGVTLKTQEQKTNFSTHLLSHSFLSSSFLWIQHHVSIVPFCNPLHFIIKNNNQMLVYPSRFLFLCPLLPSRWCLWAAVPEPGWRRLGPNTPRCRWEGAFWTAWGVRGWRGRPAAGRS